MPQIETVRVTKTELVFEDLNRLYLELNCNRRKPRIFRLAFEMYIYKSQQLTESMRSEFKSMTGQNWIASDFREWNRFTAALKDIRNAALHGCPVVLMESVMAIYPAVEFSFDEEPLPTRFKENGYRALLISSFIDTPLLENAMNRTFKMPLNGKSEDDLADKSSYCLPIKSYVSYKLKWDLLQKGVLNGLEDEEKLDAVKLVLLTFPVLKNYMKYYQSKLRENIKTHLPY